MDWHVAASYNLGTGIDGLIIIAAGLLATRGATDTYGLIRGLVVISIGMYIASRGLHWYIAALPGLSVPGDGSLFAPWASSSRTILLPFALMMSIGLATLYYVQVRRVSKVLAVIIIILSFIGYLVGGLTPQVPP